MLDNTWAFSMARIRQLDMFSKPAKQRVFVHRVSLVQFLSFLRARRFTIGVE